MNATPALAHDSVISIPGECKFLSSERVAEAFNPYRTAAGLSRLIPPKHKNDPSTLETARSHPGGPWLYVYSFGIPIRELRQMFGYSPSFRPRFNANPGESWLQPVEDYWTGVSDVQPGYYLLSIEGYGGSLDWKAQEGAIRKLFGARYERASEHLVCEAFFAAWVLNKWNNSRHGVFGPWERSYAHWGKALDSRGQRVCVGISSAGVQVGSIHPDEDGFRLRAAVARCADSRNGS